MRMYNLFEYSDNYSDKSGRLWQFKRDKVPAVNDDLTIIISESFKYKALVGETTGHVAKKQQFKKHPFTEVL